MDRYNNLLPFWCLVIFLWIVTLRFLHWNSGKLSFNRKSLHHIGSGQNPYEQAISIIGKTLSAFDEDNLIPCFGFGDGNVLMSLWYLRAWQSCLFSQIADLTVLSFPHQHRHMIKMSLVSILKSDPAMGLKKFWQDTEKLFLASD